MNSSLRCSPPHPRSATPPTPHPTLTMRHPTLTTPHPTLTTPHPTLTTPHPTLTTPHPTLTTPHPTLTTQHPTLTTQHPTLPTPHPTLTMRHPTVTMRHPTLTTRRCDSRMPSTIPRIRRAEAVIPGRGVPTRSEGIFMGRSSAVRRRKLETRNQKKARTEETAESPQRGKTRSSPSSLFRAFHFPLRAFF